jgi:3-oxoacyl-[acyl-carrier-protein] synthase-3
MTTAILSGVSLQGVATCVPDKVFDNIKDSDNFDPQEVKKVVTIAGIKQRRIVDDNTCSSDLCLKAGKQLLERLDWSPDSIDTLIFVTQTPDYFLPGTASLLHRDLGLPMSCAAFDVGLGCSGYPYALWLASMMIQTGASRRVLVMHGETASLITYPRDRATALLFGDAGSATALEREGDDSWGFCLHSDGQGYQDLMIPGRGFRNPRPENERDNYLYMNGANLFNFTIQKVPLLIQDTLTLMDKNIEDIDAFIFHQSNQFMMLHIARKTGLPAEKTPIILGKYGNAGGPSVPLTMTQHYTGKKLEFEQTAMLLGYGVGLSWGSALLKVKPETVFLHCEYPTQPIG